jgi:hypothetical protein
MNTDPLDIADSSSKNENAGRIGKAVEHLVAASCILATDTLLNVSTAFVDDEGVDLVFHRRGGTATLAVQVKARSSDTTQALQGKFIANVRQQTFRPRDGLWMLFVEVDRPTARLGTTWFVPSTGFAVLANAVGAKQRLRITASTKPDSNDKWRKFRMDFPELPARILNELTAIDLPQDQSLLT